MVPGSSMKPGGLAQNFVAQHNGCSGLRVKEKEQGKQSASQDKCTGKREKYSLSLYKGSV